MKQYFREYFTFNRRERNGVFVLLSIVLLLILYLAFSDRFTSSDKTDFSQFEKDIAVFNAQPAVADSSEGESQPTPQIKDHPLFAFNPNNLPDADWKKLGLTKKQIGVIKNYEGKGGKFKTKEDVKKMYCIQPKLYTSLEPYIQIPDDTTSHLSKSPLSLRRGVGGEAVELNSADSTQLDQLKGIGFSFAKRIIKYREVLGGYIDKEQLLEVYGLDKEKYAGLSENISVDVSKVKKININSVTFEELRKHPYIKYNLASLMVNYRKQHGKYSSVEETKKLNLVNDELFTKLVPYLTTE